MRVSFTSPQIRQRGFSLVEIVIAIGIVSFALLPTLGLLPIGLNSLRESMGQTAMANISQQIRGELQQISFNTSADFNIHNLSSTNYYFTREGLKTSASGADVYYEAALSSQDGAVAGATYDTASAQNVTIALCYPVGAPAAAKNRFSFSLLLAKQSGD